MTTQSEPSEPSEPSGRQTWTLPPLPSPVMRLWQHGSRLWAGGAGGVATRADDGAWRAHDGPLRCVAAFAASGRAVIVGGLDGIVVGDGRPGSWRPAELEGGGAPVAALLTTATGTVLAGTLGAAVLRSTDGGRRWQRSAFGLGEREVSALADVAGTVLAATDNGLFASRDDGRSWRPVADVSTGSGLDLAVADGLVALATEHDGLFVSTDAGRGWQPAGLDEAVSAVGAMPDRVLLAGTDDGRVHRSTDDGRTWTLVGELGAAVLTVCPTPAGAALGTAFGLWQTDPRGERLAPADPPPVGDLRTLVLAGERVLLTGAQGGLVDTGLSSPGRDDGVLSPSVLLEAPVTAVDVRADGSVLAAVPDGLLCSSTLQQWDHLPAPSGVLEHLSFAADGVAGYAAASGATSLAATGDGGRSWRQVPLPWAGEWIVAVQALGDGALVGSWDPSRQWLRVWLLDGADAWSEGPSLQTAAPRVSTSGAPPAFAVGRTVHVAIADDAGNAAWMRTADPRSAVLRLTGHGTALVAQTAAGLESWDAGADRWTVLDPPDEADPVVDLGLSGAGLSGAGLWTLHASGRVQRRRIG